MISGDSRPNEVNDNNSWRILMRRRDFIKVSAGFGAAVATLAPLSPARAQTKSVFKASDVHPAGYPTVVATENLGKKLEAATNGRLSLQMYPSMQLGGEKETIEQTQIGAIQLTRVSVGALGPVVDDLNVLNMTFLFKNTTHALTEHLIVPEMLVFSKKVWGTLSKEDHALLMKFGREAQAEERVLWTKYEQEAMAKAKAAGVEITEIADKKPFQDAVKPVWDKYGPKYADMIKRIQAA